MGQSQARKAKVAREYTLSGSHPTCGVTFDGRHAWVARGDELQAFDPEDGNVVRRLSLNADAGTAFDGRHIFQLVADRIHKVDLHSGESVGSIPAPGGGRDSGLTWAEGLLWVGQHHDRKIHQIDPETGAILRTIESDRFVTGVTWSNGELWHATQEDGVSELRHVDHETGEVVERIAAPEGVSVSGLSTIGPRRFLCGGGSDRRVRELQHPDYDSQDDGPGDDDASK